MGRDPVLSLVLRLRAGPATRGQLVGQAEVVDTGEVVPVHDEGDLYALVRRMGARDTGSAGGSRPEQPPGS